MIDGMNIVPGNYGPRAEVMGGWSDRLTRYALDNDIVELGLNYAKGWTSGDISFLIDLPQLLALDILDLRTSPSLDPIHHLSKLRSLRIITYCKSEIRFSAFPKLEDCALQWRRRATSLFDCVTLKSLFIDHYTGSDLKAFERLIDLESLALLNAPIKSLEGVSVLKKLQRLRLGNLRGLKSLAGIQELNALQELSINTCRAISSINEVGCLSNLQKLHINNIGSIESLKPLDRLNDLRSVLFWESTNIVDGDLYPLTRQRSLSRVSFQNRRHYSHRREELQTHGERDCVK